MIHCCRDCDKREIGCHSTCETYINAKKEHDQEIEKIKIEKIKMNIGRYYVKKWNSNRK